MVAGNWAKVSLRAFFMGFFSDAFESDSAQRAPAQADSAASSTACGFFTATRSSIFAA